MQAKRLTVDQMFHIIPNARNATKSFSTIDTVLPLSAMFNNKGTIFIANYYVNRVAKAYFDILIYQLYESSGL